MQASIVLRIALGVITCGRREHRNVHGRLFARDNIAGRLGCFPAPIIGERGALRLATTQSAVCPRLAPPQATPESYSLSAVASPTLKTSPVHPLADRPPNPPSYASFSSASPQSLHNGLRADGRTLAAARSCRKRLPASKSRRQPWHNLVQGHAPKRRRITGGKSTPDSAERASVSPLPSR